VKDSGATGMIHRSVAAFGSIDGVGLAFGWNGIDSPSRVIDVVDIRPRGDRGDITNPG
jgi:hypothetical protein